MKEIKLNQNKYAIVDDEDFDFLNQWKWFYKKSKTGEYARRNIRIKDSKPYKDITVYMHREILKAAQNQTIDHINRNGLDNRKKNLRFCTLSQNQANRGKQINNTSGFKGVYFYKPTKRWRPRINVNRKQICLGSYKNIIEAVKIYNENAIKYFGSFARLNIINN